LQNLLEEIGADQQLKGTLLVYFFRLRFHALVDPVAALGIGDVVDFYAMVLQ